MATQLRIDPDMVMGKLVRLWSWAEVNRINGNDLGVTHEFLDKVAGKKGFAAALERCGWLREENGKLAFANFQRHNGPSGKGRALTAMRVAKHRAKKRNDDEMEPSQDGRMSNQFVTNESDWEIEEETEVTPTPESSVPEVSQEVQEEEVIDRPAAETELQASAVDETEEGGAAGSEDDSPKKKRGKAAGGAARKVPVAEPPDQPLLFGL